jgi:hypothetical protein
VAAKDPARFEAAAIRWHDRFEVEMRGVGFAESAILLARSPPSATRHRNSASRTSRASAERFRVQSVALEARRRTE